MIPQHTLNEFMRSIKSKETCHACLKSKPVKKNQKSPHLNTLIRPLERISADLLYLGYRHFHIIIDHYTSFLWVHELKPKVAFQLYL